MTARLLRPSAGKITINDKDFAELPEAVTGRRISYADQNPYIFGGTMQDNLLYGLKHRPLGDANYDDEAAAARGIAIKPVGDKVSQRFHYTGFYHFHLMQQ